jgi:uncharacterized C2H2 Zn-finger protein
MTNPKNTTGALSAINDLVTNESCDLEDTLLTCDYCGQIFAEKTELVVHISSAHSQNLVSPVIPTGNKSLRVMKHQPDYCNVNDCMDGSYKGCCQKRTRLGNLKHFVIAKQQVPCSICGNVFNRKFDLYKHVKKHRVQEFVFTDVGIPTGYPLVTP